MLFLSFKVDAQSMEDKVLFVRRFTGVEELSRPYRFEIELASREPLTSSHIADIMSNRAHLGIRHRAQPGGSDSARDALPLYFHGRISEFVRVAEHKSEKGYPYRAVLVPRLWFAGLERHSRVFKDKTTHALAKQILTAAPYNLDCDFSEFSSKSGGSYSIDSDPRAHLVQYEESDLNFVSRWLEHDGITYFFHHDQAEDHEKVIFTRRTDVRHESLPGRSDEIDYDPGAGGNRAAAEDWLASSDVSATDSWFASERISEIEEHYNPVPEKVELRGYEYNDTGESVRASASVQTDGQIKPVLAPGQVMDDFKNAFTGQDMANALAKIRASELRCRSVHFTGRSDVREFRAGEYFAIGRNRPKGFPETLVLTKVEHYGEQLLDLSAGGAKAGRYENSFRAIPSDVPFKPERSTSWPAVTGLMPARVAAGKWQGNGDDWSPEEYAQLDSKGRYTVKLPLEGEDTRDGNAVAKVRLGQSFSGDGTGMHFPLHDQTEVMLGHINGDPDRPFIVTTAYNESDHDPLIDAEGEIASRANVIATSAGNRITLRDDENERGIRIETYDGHNAIELAGEDEHEKITLKNRHNVLLMNAREDHERVVITNKFEDKESYIRLGKKRSTDEVEVEGAAEFEQAKVTAGHGVAISSEEEVTLLSKEEVKIGAKLVHIETTEGVHTIAHGPVVEKHLGIRKTEIVTGGKFDLFVGGQAGMTIGVAAEVFAGVRVEKNVGLDIELGGLEGKIVYVKGPHKALYLSDKHVNCRKDLEVHADKIHLTAKKAIQLQVGSTLLVVGKRGLEVVTNGSQLSVSETRLLVNGPGPQSIQARGESPGKINGFNLDIPLPPPPPPLDLPPPPPLADLPPPPPAEVPGG